MDPRYSKYEKMQEKRQQERKKKSQLKCHMRGISIH
jgi:hypothetical protein